jgi:deoxycytidine triphosphate deaminase
MSVVHIQQRITRDQKSFEENAASDRSLLWLSANAKAEVFSIDLTVGEQWSEKYGPTSNAMYKIADEGMSVVRHGSVVVTAAENIRVPHNMYGVLVPTGSLFLDKGILIAPAKVEPSFSGYLKLRLFNTTALKYNLMKGDKLGSVIFFSTEITQFQKTVVKESVLIKRPVSIDRRAIQWLHTNGRQVISWLVTLFSGSVMAALFMHFVLQPHFPVASKPSILPVAPSVPGASAPLQVDKP